MKKLLVILLTVCLLFPCVSAFAGDVYYRSGDVNLDGIVSTGDASAVLKYSVGRFDLGADALVSGDLNNDGVVNTGDAVSILKKCVCQLSTDFVVSRSFPTPDFNNMRVSSDWIGYGWIKEMASEVKSAYVIFDASTGEELDKFTDPALCPFQMLENAEESGTIRDLTAKYDEEFFEGYDVVFLAIREPMIPRRVELSDVSFVENKTILGVTVFYPEVVMQASQDYLMIVEIPKAYTQGREIAVESGCAYLH